MSLVYKKGDLLEAHKDGVTIIGHQCNCRGGWNRGIHAAIGKKWPNVIEKYISFKWHLGDMRIFETGIPNFRIAYLAGQDGYGNAARTGLVYTNYKALEEAIIKLYESLDPRTDKVGFPLIGAGLAGGDWSVIEDIIIRVFKGVPVTIYKLEE